MKLRNFLALAGSSLLAMSSAHSATLSGLAVSGGEFQWPTSTLLADFEHTSAGVGSQTGHDVKQARNQGQTFTITQNGTIDLIAINFEAFVPTGNANFTFNFFQVVSATNPTMVGSVIDSLTVTAADITALGFSSGNTGTLVFDVTDTAVTANSTYAWQLITNSSDANHIIKLRRNTNNDYTDGQAFGTTGGATDYHFGVYNIPEPTTALLGGLGLLALLRRRR